jgi:hypothetical protein
MGNGLPSTSHGKNTAAIINIVVSTDTCVLSPICRYFKDRDTPLDESQWCGLLDFSYALSELPCEHTLHSVHSTCDLSRYGLNAMKGNSSTNSSRIDNGGTRTFHPYLYKLQAILHEMCQLRRQYALIDGYKNIWVIKAPDSSCGVGIKVLSRLNDILQCEKGKLPAPFLFS